VSALAIAGAEPHNSESTGELMMLKASKLAVAVAVIGPLALALTSESFGALSYPMQRPSKR
jgi:hypothetical protein